MSNIYQPLAIRCFHRGNCAPTSRYVNKQSGALIESLGSRTLVLRNQCLTLLKLADANPLHHVCPSQLRWGAKLENTDTANRCNFLKGGLG
jgi:hypothetical protein